MQLPAASKNREPTTRPPQHREPTSTPCHAPQAHTSDAGGGLLARTQSLLARSVPMAVRVDAEPMVPARREM